MALPGRLSHQLGGNSEMNHMTWCVVFNFLWSFRKNYCFTFWLISLNWSWSPFRNFVHKYLKSYCLISSCGQQLIVIGIAYWCTQMGLKTCCLISSVIWAKLHVLHMSAMP
jgi:hypothetical protein